MAWEGGVAGDAFDVLAAAAVAAFHDDLRVAAQRAGGAGVAGLAVREAGLRPVAVGGGAGGGEVVQGLDVGDFGRFAGEFGVGGEGAEWDGWAGGLEGGDGAVDGVEGGGGGARV